MSSRNYHDVFWQQADKDVGDLNHNRHASRIRIETVSAAAEKANHAQGIRILAGEMKFHLSKQIRRG